MNHYDYIFAGAGCAGLSLVHYLLESKLKDSKILLIDPLGDSIPNKTWCYWAEKPLEIHPKAHTHSWNNISFLSGDSKITKSLGRLNYFHLNSHDFYNSIVEKIKNHPNVRFIQDEVMELVTNENITDLKTKQHGIFSTSQVIDSRFNSEELSCKTSLKQIFTGWRIQTEKAVFDPSSVILMEFPKGIAEQFEFIYILPFSETEALVEYTAYSQMAISDEKLKDSLTNYLKENLGDISYQITFKESGMIPMSTQKSISPKQRGVLKIGTAAGWTKASTGYTFHTIQNNCKEIVKALESGRVDKLNFESPLRFTFYDNILLNIAHKWPNRLQNLFMNLFTTSSADLVLRFLSEETTFREELKLLGKLRFPIFIKSLLNYETH